MSGTITIEGDQVVFEIHGVDEFLAVKHTLSVPLDRVVSVSTEEVDWQMFQQMKVAGANLPGVVKDGRFLTKDGMMFYEMHHPGKCVTVTLDHDTYRRIVFEVDDKEQAAKAIEDALRKARPTGTQG